MANEVTINIESSLAAMAFVLADQQQELKDLRELVKDYQHNSDTWENACKEKQQELDTLQKKSDDLSRQLAAESERADETYEALEKEREQHQEDIAHLENVKLPGLKWQPWHGDVVSVPIRSVLSQGKNIPLALRVLRVERDDAEAYDITGERVNAGHIFVEPVGLSTNGENYDMPQNCRYGVSPLFYAILDVNDLLTVADKCMLDRIGQAEAE